MAQHGEIEQFGASSFARVLRYIVTHRLILTGIGFDAVSFLSFMALLSVAELSFAVPATALGYILKTALAQFYLGERVTLRRWTGAICIALGVVLIAF
jgi:uncharacterized membrane protein